MFTNQPNIKGSHRSLVFPFIIIVVGFVILCGCLYLYYKNYDVVNIISIVGSVASLAGISLALQQVWGLKNKTAAVEDALNSAREQFASLNVFNDLTSHSQFIGVVEGHLRNKHYSEALITYTILKEKLTVLLGYTQQKEELKIYFQNLRALVDDAGSDIKTLNKVVMGSSLLTTLIDVETMMDNLGKIKTELDYAFGQLRHVKE